MKIHKGNLEIIEGNTIDYSEVEEVTGYLFIHSNADFRAPQLKSVGGYLSVYSNVDLRALKSVGGYLFIHSNADLRALKSVGGDLSIYSNADLRALKSVGGDLSIHSKISINTAKNLWSANRKDIKKIWTISNKLPDWLIKRVATRGNSVFVINDTKLPFEWFEKIRKDALTAEEVFAIDNIEHRRIAYEYMDKAKMKALKNFKILDAGVDEKGKDVKIISFNVQNMKEDLIFYNCIDASTDREYFLQTKETTWKEAKDALFGMKNVEWVNEW